MAHGERAHSSIGASSAARWMNCPGSVRMSEGMPNTSSVFAQEGTAAHELAEHCLQHGYRADRFLGWFVDLKFGEIYRSGTNDQCFEVTQEMADAVQLYLDTVRSTIKAGDEYEFEQRFDLSDLHAGMFGTADFSCYRPATRELFVLDYKHGKGVPVEAKENPQGVYYAIGAARAKANRGIDAVHIGIVQPRADHDDGPVRWWTIDGVDLMDWQSDIVAAAKRTEEPDAPLNPGSWCRFCPAAGICPALENKALEEARADFADDGTLHVSDPATYTPEGLARTLEHVNLIQTWINRVHEFAHAEAEAGRCPPGWKLVEKRANRTWTNEDHVVQALKDYGLDEGDLYEKKLKTPAKVEKTIGKKNADILSDLVEKRSSGTTLAPESDKRPAVKPEAASEFADSVET